MKDVNNVTLDDIYEESVSTLDIAKNELLREQEKKLYNWEKWRIYTINICLEHTLHIVL